MKNYLIGLFSILIIVIIYLIFFSQSSLFTSFKLKKEINLEKGTADHKAQKVGNVSIEDIIKVTNVKYSGMLEKEFTSAVKSVLGTCESIGV